ncbi:hypothetical protein PaG_04013 [Moesziomyces aphidis]|jgi:hypothetical protein|uniref:Uncharacterized protein n=1 Tax=Moesziomyces aphidis TaxID=84754 RepID=W3VJR7_MOEAP|nr:hypothetical protein PaG_04013 [Moesziomyces aphidis]
MPEEREGTGLLMGVCAGDASIGELGAGAGEAQEAIVGSGLRIKLVNLFVLLEAAVDELARASDDGQTVALGQVGEDGSEPFLGSPALRHDAFVRLGMHQSPLGPLAAAGLGHRRGRASLAADRLELRHVHERHPTSTLSEQEYLLHLHQAKVLVD